MPSQQTPGGPALKSAVAFVRKGLLTVWGNGDRLPTTTELAQMAGVSRGTMVKAIAVLTEEGKVTAVRRRGIVAGSLPVARAERRSSRVQQKWERLKHRIEYDLYDGDFHKLDALPAAKQLQAHYGVDFRTLKKSLESLVGEKVLRLHKRSYRIVRPEEEMAENGVAYVSMTALYNTPYRNYPEAGDLIRVLETECGRRKLQFRPLANHDMEAFRKSIDDYRILGGLFHQSGPHWRETYEEFAALRKPMSVFDNYNHVQASFGDKYLQKSRIRVFQFDEIYAGCEVARFLLRLGHRRIAFISPFHGDWVYPIRYESLREVFEGPGNGNVARLVAADNIRHVLQERATQRLEARGKSARSPGAEQDIREELQELGLDEGSDETLANWAARKSDWTISADHMFNALLYRELKPMFEEAIGLEGTTAWVCANDGIAIHALRFLRATGVAVPDTLSVVGFDNTGSASYNDLTSYDFDVPAIALKMLDHILRPDSALYSPSQRIVNSEGMVIPRGSVIRKSV